MKTLIENIGCLITMDESRPMILDATVLIEDECIVWCGLRKDFRDQKVDQRIDARACLVSPGLVDCHTHLIFDGDRAKEFFLRAQGHSYESILQKGMGIHETVEKTRRASKESLLEQINERLNLFLKFGVTSVEIKTGYGLSFEDEIMHLNLIKQYQGDVDLRATLMAAHVVPKEYKNKKEKYVELITQKIIPYVSQHCLAYACDVFCDSNAFNLDESRIILDCAQKHGLKIKLHADQLSAYGATRLAHQFNALSVDHLDYASDEDLRLLLNTQTVCVLIPGSVFATNKTHYANANKMIEMGLKVAISTDCNPGSSHSENLPLAMTLAALKMKMNPMDVFKAVTLNAALAMGLHDRGQIKVGQLADLVVWNEKQAESLMSHYGCSLAKHVIKKGRLLF